ncbi:aspartyl-phosphate phosphatase Spo0E family protein [Clostridium botulinum]|uniref:aspartyl-phosphate phosphatase Spo0E family protein n=1 Tax=Clostridium botulinum TaxID=1491 RepID=UPI0019683723|nr:aspartyl-phosphate phosphatase Spo0E family protein [Clostridium botulinum]MBN1079239.1 aspartyl-phosphate phosphatase Spo0E family protein [Clostridium botulinum]
MDFNLKKIDLLKKMLYKSIDKNGLTADLTVKLSQKLDPYMVEQQRGTIIG